MTHGFLRALAFGLAVAATPAFAQDTTEEPTEEAQSGAAADQPASAASEGDETVEAVHGDWQVRCSTAREECYLYQLARDARDVPVAEMSVVLLKDNAEVAAGITVITPLRSLLTEGLAVQIDNNSVRKYQYSWCTEVGCFARFGVTQQGLDGFKRGNLARLTVVSAERPDAPVILDVSLAGFTAATADLAGR